MIRTLFIIAGAALVLCIVTAGGAIAIGGQDLQRHGWAWTFRDEDGDAVRFERVDGADDPDVTRTLAWTGGDRLVVDAPGDIVYIQGQDARVELSGPQSVIDHVRLAGGRLTVDDVTESSKSYNAGAGPVSVHGTYKTFPSLDGLKVTITAPGVRNFDVNAVADLEIRNYDQPSIKIISSAAGDVTAQGRSDAAEATLSGSGDVDLSDLAVEEATLVLSGSGLMRAGPTSRAQINLSGSGDIDLTRRPAYLGQSVSGTGRVTQD